MLKQASKADVEFSNKDIEDAQKLLQERGINHTREEVIIILTYLSNMAELFFKPRSTIKDKHT